MKKTLTTVLATAALALAAHAFAAAPAVTPSDYTEQPELWTCGAEDWGPWYAQCAGTPDRPAAGKYSVVLNYCQGAEHYLAYPKFRNADWDLSNAEYLEFKVKMPKGQTFRGPNPVVYLRNYTGFIRIRPKNRKSFLDKESDGEWLSIRVPLKADPDWETYNWMDTSIKHIDFFEIAFSGNNNSRYVSHDVQVDDVHFVGVQPTYTAPNTKAADLDVLVIERTPVYKKYTAPEYDGINGIMMCDNKDEKHQPAKGEIVTFTAHVQNKGKAPAGGSYVWILDGKEVGKGTIKELKTRETATFAYKWKWEQADHDISFKLTPSSEDYCARNNDLTVRTNAIQWIHVIERGTMAQVEEKTNMIGSYSFEDWLQSQVRYMNQLMPASTYDFAPKGVLSRVAIGKIEYVDDGEVGRRCSDGPYQIGEQNPFYDGGRGCTLRDTFWDNSEQGPTFLNFLNFVGRPDGAWLHEMSHQNGIIDLYQLITSPEDNKINGVGFRYENTGLMGAGNIAPHQNTDFLYNVYSPSEVFGYNYTYQKRRGYFGEYLYCMAQQNTLVLTGPDGKPVADADIKIYQTHIGENGERGFEATPVLEGKSDGQGRFLLKNRPVAKKGTTETGCELHDNPFGPIHVVGFNAVFLIIAKPANGPETYGFTTVPEFNIAFAKGNKEKADIPVDMKIKGNDKWYIGRL